MNYSEGKTNVEKWGLISNCIINGVMLTIVAISYFAVVK
jgi:hypothetical protein